MSYSPEYYEANKESIKAGQKVWRSNNAETVKKVQAEWRASNEGHTYTDSTGYVKYIGFKHPAANPAGVTSYHRIVLWDWLDGQDAYCHWGCGTWLMWSKKYPEYLDGLVVDHINLDKTDNVPFNYSTGEGNLVASCAKCNLSRPGGQKERVRTRNLGQCKFDGCNRDAKASEYCSGHYNQQWSNKELSVIGTHGGFLTEQQIRDIVLRVSQGDTIISIGNDMNFDPSTISRVFKKVTGLSIREYKTSIKKSDSI